MTDANARTDNSHQPSADGPRSDAGDLARRTLIVVGITATVAVVLLLVWYALHIFLLAFAGLLVALLLNTLTRWLSTGTRLGYRTSFVIVVLLLVAMLAGGFWLLGAQVSRQVSQLSQNLPGSLEQLRNELRQYEWGRWLVRHAPEAEQILEQTDAVSRLTGMASALVNFIAGVVIILFVGLYAGAEPRVYFEGLLRLVPLGRRDRARQVLTAVGENLRWWLLGQLAGMVVVGLLTGLGLWLLDVPQALVLAILAFGLEIVPYLGPILAAIPALLLVWPEGMTQVLYVGLLYVGIQSAEGYVVLPLAYRETVSLPPVLAILAVVLMGLVGGVLGVFVAAPLVVAAMVLVKMLYVQDVLGDRSIEVQGAPEGEE